MNGGNESVSCGQLTRGIPASGAPATTTGHLNPAHGFPLWEEEEQGFLMYSTNHKEFTSGEYIGGTT